MAESIINDETSQPIPNGKILVDISGQKWIVGQLIGKGEFAEFYTTKMFDNIDSNFECILKMEPFYNKPLFTEWCFYKRYVRKQNIKAFCKKHNLKLLGIPYYLSCGAYYYKEKKYRYLVLEKLGDNINDIFQYTNGFFSIDTVCKLVVQLTYALEFIHENGFIHGNIKGDNILMGDTDENKHQAYLIDFGLLNSVKRKLYFNQNLLMANKSNVQFMSIDAHYGVSTRRGDIEILSYNILYWLGIELPWWNISDPRVVKMEKENFFKKMLPRTMIIQDKIKKEYLPKAIIDFFIYIKYMQWNEMPNYQKIRELFHSLFKSTTFDLTFEIYLKKLEDKKKSDTMINEENDNPDIDGDMNDDKLLEISYNCFKLSLDKLLLD